MSKYEIIWMGDENTNNTDRRGYAPLIIIDHICDSSAEPYIDWVTSPDNSISSVHFLVTKEGTIYQFVAIEDAALGNGLKNEQTLLSTAQIVKKIGVNPDWYSVSIKHEGVYDDTKGALTEKQLNATIWLHQYIINYVGVEYNTIISPDREHILGHNEVNPTKRPNCPGGLFPFEQIIEAIKPTKKMLDIKNHWAEESILEVVEAGLMVGYTDGTFKPDKPITRAELATVLKYLLERGT